MLSSVDWWHSSSKLNLSARNMHSLAFAASSWSQPDGSAATGAMMCCSRLSLKGPQQPAQQHLGSPLSINAISRSAPSAKRKALRVQLRRLQPQECPCTSFHTSLFTVSLFMWRKDSSTLWGSAFCLTSSMVIKANVLWRKSSNASPGQSLS